MTPFSSVDSLPPNWVIVQWMAQLNITSSSHTEIKCESCEGENPQPATHWCEICTLVPNTPQYYCQQCNLSEHSSRNTKTHQRITLNEKKLKEKSKPIPFPQCLSHHEDKKFYCVEDKVYLCSVW